MISRLTVRRSHQVRWLPLRSLRVAHRWMRRRGGAGKAADGEAVVETMWARLATVDAIDFTMRCRVRSSAQPPDCPARPSAKDQSSKF